MTRAGASRSSREPGRGAPGRTVGLFVTCLTDTFFPQVGAALVRVLRHFGCRVEFPAGQTCCGQPALNSGFPREAADLARRMIALFEAYPFVVTPSASCAAAVGHFPELLAQDGRWSERARRLAARTREFTCYLRDELGQDVGQLLRRLPRDGPPVTYHYPCHARGVYEHDELRAALSVGLAERLQPPPRADECCGFGGVFAVDFPGVSTAMMGEKLDALSASGAAHVVCNEGGCALHLSGGANRRGLSLRFVHVAELIAEALDSPAASQP